MNTPRVKEILGWYGSDNPGTLTNLARLLNHGRLGGTGKLVILPVDQGFEHGPARSFAVNPAGLRSALPFRAGDRGGLQRLCRAARFHRGGRARIRRGNSAHSQGQQPRRACRTKRIPLPGADQQRGGRVAARLRRDRVHDLSRLGASRRNVRASARGCGRGEGGRAGRRDLVLSARLRPEQGGRDRRSTCAATPRRSPRNSARTSSR